jgi:hypothetical protein
METMFTRAPRRGSRLSAFAVLGAIGALMAPVAASAATPPQTIQINATVTARPVGLITSEAATLAGVTTDPVLGEGAAVYKVAYPALTYTFVEYQTNGTFHGSGQLVAATTAGLDGMRTLSGPVNVTGGTGDYKGAKGTLQLTGSTAPSFEDTLNVTGTLSVPAAGEASHPAPKKAPPKKTKKHHHS